MEAENRSCFLLLSFQTHSDTLPYEQAAVNCVLRKGMPVTAAIVRQYQDGLFIMDWLSYWCAPLTSIGRADVTFSWPSPCWLSWESSTDNSAGLRAVSLGQRHTCPLT